MPVDELVLYLVLLREDLAACEAMGFIPRRFAIRDKPLPYVSLREDLVGATQRMEAMLLIGQ